MATTREEKRKALMNKLTDVHRMLVEAHAEAVELNDNFYYTANEISEAMAKVTAAISSLTK